MGLERDRFLVEAMGECCHEWEPAKGINTYSGNRASDSTIALSRKGDSDDSKETYF